MHFKRMDLLLDSSGKYNLFMPRLKVVCRSSRYRITCPFPGTIALGTVEMAEFDLPPGHPISIEQAKELMKGPLADVYRGILAKSCAPLFWYQNGADDSLILNNGTVTFL